MIRMLLDGMLSDLGYTMTAEAGALDEAIALAKQAEFDVAILDVNLHSEPITPVAEILTQRGLPFVFATGDRPARRAGSLSRPSDLAEAVPGRGAGSGRCKPLAPKPASA